MAEGEHGEKKEEKKGDQKPKEEKLVLSRDQQKNIEKLDKTMTASALVKELYGRASSDYNTSPEYFKKGDLQKVLDLAGRIGQYKGFLKKVRGVMGSLKYYIGRGYESKYAREARGYIKEMEGEVKRFLNEYVKGSKELRKAGFKAMKPYEMNA